MIRSNVISTVVSLTIIVVLVARTAHGAPSAEPTAAVGEPSQAAPVQSAPNTIEPVQGRTDREQTVAHRLSSPGADGEVCWLGSDSQGFLAIYRESYESVPHGGLIINISSGGIVDARPIHQVLARTAAAAGWAALSVQPRPADGAVPDEAGVVEAKPRLDAAFDYLVGNGVQNIVIVGDAAGAIDAINYIIDKASPAISGFVGLGKWDASLEGTDIPILDIAGTRDQGAIAFKAKRQVKFRQRETPIEQLEIDGAGPEFYGYEDQLAKRIRGWLERVTPGVAVLQR